MISALASVQVALDQRLEALADRVARDDAPHKPSTAKIHEHGEACFDLARWTAEVSAAKTLLETTEGRSPAVQQLSNYAAARAIQAVCAAARIDVPDGVDEAASGQAAGRVAELALDGALSSADAYMLAEDHEDIRVLFREFADGKVAPLAEHIHCEDALIPEDLIADYAELGALGITIPEQYGGMFIDHRSMALATEELSRASLGAGGSVITRPEIAAKALLSGGTEEQKSTWLPRIAGGEEIVSIAVTEPGAGSDVARLRLAAKKVDGGYELTGEKTWCTFAGRASLLLVLARTGTADEGARGLTLFLAQKTPTKAPADDRSFQHDDGRGGTISGRAIPTVGYRGMHSFTVFFEKWFVPDDGRIGPEGGGFALQMKGFAGGRIQTAARAVGVMEAAFRAAVAYTKERRVFGRTLDQLPLVRRKLADMAARVALSRQMTYAVCDQMDDGGGQVEASLVKLLACKDAETVTREAMQLHGGMGYSEEFAVSRYWQDARVLSIFEGAEEALAILVIARSLLRERLAARA